MGEVRTGREAPAVRDALAALARALQRVAVNRHARADHAGVLEAAWHELRAVLEVQPSLVVTVALAGLAYEGHMLPGEPLREHDYCVRLYRDGVRSLSFRRGLALHELVVFARVVAGDGDGEDPVTELWKADLPNIGYTLAPGYRMEKGALTVAGISARVAQALAAPAFVDGGDDLGESGQETELWGEAQRVQADAHDWPRLAGRAALTILRIVAEEYAGWDFDALQDTFAHLSDGLLEHRAAQPLAQALATLKTLHGTQAPQFREWMSRWLSDPARLGFIVEMQDARLIHASLALLPHGAGLHLIPVWAKVKDQAAREALASGILARIDSCSAQVVEILRAGPALELKPLLAGLSGLTSGRRMELATAAFQNPDPAVALQSVDHLALEPGVAARTLGPALQHHSRDVRMASAVALAGMPGSGERAARCFVEAIASPRFASADAEEMAVFHRALGKLGSNVGFMYLSSQLTLPPKKLFGRKKRTQQQLLAVEGLAEEGSPRSLRALDDASSVKRGYSKPVAAASQAAAQRVRTRKMS
jgi:hypothetical protein